MNWYRVHFRKKQIIVAGEAELERVKARKVPQVIQVDPMKVHRCDECGKEEAWLDTWRWFGSYQDLDDGKPVVKLCSFECQKAHETDQLLANRRMIHEPARFDYDHYRELDKAKKAANPRQFPPVTWPKEKTGNGWCRWCGKPISEGRRRTWHADCLETFFCHTDLSHQYRHLVERDGEACGICGSDGTYWQYDLGSVFTSGLDRSTVWGEFTAIYRRRKLEVDHVIELWEVQDLPDDERRPFFGPNNLWLLCQPCHKAKSAEMTAKRAKSRLLASVSPKSLI